MILGLFVCFFMQPVIVKVDGEGYAVAGPKPEGCAIHIQEILNDCEVSDN